MRKVAMMTESDLAVRSQTVPLSWNSVTQPEYIQAALAIYQASMNTPSVRDTCRIIYNRLTSIMPITRFFCAIKTEVDKARFRAFIDNDEDQLVYLGSEPESSKLLSEVFAGERLLLSQDYEKNTPLGPELEGVESWVLVPMASLVGQISLVIGACSDQLTTFTEIDTQLLIACAEAIMAVATRALVVDNVISSERERIMAEAAGDLLHEITNLLGTIPPYIDIIGQLLDAASLSLIEQYLNSVKSDAIEVQTVCRSKLADIRSQMGRSKLVPTDVAGVLESARAACLGERLDVHILRTETSPDIPRVLVRPRDLFEVFKEIIRNGLQAMGESEERILTLRGKPWTSLDGRVWAEIEIEDTGCGISPDDMEKVWDLSYSTKFPLGGYGLYRAKSTIESFGGEISVTSQLNVGTTFRIRLPGEVRP